MRHHWLALIFFGLALLVQVLSPATAAFAAARVSTSSGLTITDASGTAISLIICTHDEGGADDSGQHKAHFDHCPFCHGAIHIDALISPDFLKFAPDLASIRVLRALVHSSSPRSHIGLAFHSRGPPRFS